MEESVRRQSRRVDGRSGRKGEVGGAEKLTGRRVGSGEWAGVFMGWKLGRGEKRGKRRVGEGEKFRRDDRRWGGGGGV